MSKQNQEIATREEVEGLKANWKNDPCWDLEDSGGKFAPYYDELLAFSNKCNEEWELKHRNKKIKKIEAFKNLKLHQWTRISHDLIVTRVIGGWLYETTIESSVGDEFLGNSISTTFVPFTNQQDFEQMINDLIASI